ncbi:MAG: hypothetical protein C4289_00435, partial [Chloroflexota bacterium]
MTSHDVVKPAWTGTPYPEILQPEVPALPWRVRRAGGHATRLRTALPATAGRPAAGLRRGAGQQVGAAAADVVLVDDDTASS